MKQIHHTTRQDYKDEKSHVLPIMHHMFVLRGVREGVYLW